ncbi:acetyl-CoA carboxylase biotin carboxyl carrier protein [Candidatus Margulisiibacteriota bacterium]
MDLGKIKKLIKLVEKADISELAIEDDGVKIDIKKESAMAIPHAHVGAVMAPPVQHHVQPMHTPEGTTEEKAPKKEDDTAGLVPIKSPMVGTFYRSPSPDAPPFVDIGQKIEKGNPVCIVEAMKMFNEIESDISGTVERILVKNSDPVEFGQTLILVAPN